MFTPAESAIGAVLIHFATTSFFSETGKTIGFSSTINNAIFHPSTYACSIVAGVLLSSAVTWIFLPEFVPQYPNVSLWSYITAGLFTGAGTSLGSGCTSGHMLAGVSLLRVRSIVATAVFSSVAALIVNYWDLAPACDGPCYVYDPSFLLFRNNKQALLVISIAGYISSFILLPILGDSSIVRPLSGLNAGFLFGMGLLISGMASPAKPLGFLSFLHVEKFDPSLIMIVLLAILPNMFRWRHYMKVHSRPMLEPSYSSPSTKSVTKKMLIGNALFGVGWGSLGTCPGPGLLGVVFNNQAGLSWLVAFVLAYKAASMLS